MIGLWPVHGSDESVGAEELDDSRMFVDRLLGTAVSGLTPARRIEALKLMTPSEQQITDLERFLRSAATKRLLPALTELADKKHLWVNALRLEEAGQAIQSIDLSPWRTSAGNITKWCGLEGAPDGPPELILNSEAEKTGDYSKLEVKWKAQTRELEGKRG